MKIPPIIESGYFRLRKNPYLKPKNENPYLQPLKQDSLSFSSTAKYLKKYVTLPDEIKKTLSPKDAVDMFRNMEMIAMGSIKGDKIAQGKNASVYQNYWLDDYCFIVLKDNNSDKQIVYSREKLGDSVWSDKDNTRIQIIRQFA